MPNNPIASNALKTFFNDAAAKEAWEKSEARGKAVLNDGEYLFDLPRITVGPKANRPGVLQIVWGWLVASGPDAGKEYPEFQDFDKGNPEKLQQQFGFLKTRIMQLGYDPAAVSFSPALGDDLAAIAAGDLRARVKLVTTSVAGQVGTQYEGTVSHFQRVYIHEIVDSGASYKSAQQPAASTPAETTAAPAAPRGRGRPKAGSPPIASAPAAAETAPAETPASPPETAPAATPPVETAPGKAETAKVPASGGITVEFIEGFPNLTVGHIVKYKIYGKEGAQEFSGDLVDVPEDEALPMIVRRAGTMRQDSITPEDNDVEIIMD